MEPRVSLAVLKGELVEERECGREMVHLEGHDDRRQRLRESISTCESETSK